MRRFLVIAGAILVLAASAYTVYWFSTARALRDGLGRWAEARRADGYELRWRDLAIDGFPFAFRLHLAQAEARARRPVPSELDAPALIGTAAPWSLRVWHVEAPNGATLRISGEEAAVAVATAQGDVATGATETTVSAKAHELTSDGSAQSVTAGTLELHLTLPARQPESHADPAFALAAQLTDLRLPYAPPRLGGTVNSVALEGAMKGRLPPGPLPQALAAWRDDGGTIEIENARCDWGRLAVTLTGTLALDAALQPEGALTARVSGADTIIDSAADAGALDPQLANFLKALLRAMALTGPEAGDSVSVPVSLQEGRLFVGPAAIAKLPRISWN